MSAIALAKVRFGPLFGVPIWYRLVDAICCGRVTLGRDGETPMGSLADDLELDGPELPPRRGAVRLSAD